jgi:hypothetical protein
MMQQAAGRDSASAAFRRGSLDIVIVAAAFFAISAWSASTQRMERLYADGQKYQWMSEQIAESLFPVTAPGPFVYRIATPWAASVLRPAVVRVLPRLAARIDGRVGMIGVAPFYVLNIAAAAVAAMLLVLYLRSFVPDAIVRAALATAWIATWLAPARFVHFYPVNVDAAFFVVLLAALLVVEHTRDWEPLRSALLLAPVVFVGTLVRESMLLGALAFVVARVSSARGPSGRRILASAVPPAAWALAIAWVRRLVVASPPYDGWGEATQMIHEKPVFTWLLAWFFTFGPPAVALVCAAWREAAALVRRRPEIGVHVVVCGILAFIGGTDTERILSWAAPAVYVVVGVAIAARRGVLARMPALIALLVVVQLASSRLFWPIPVGIDRAEAFATLQPGWAAVAALADKFLVIHNYYSNLWSFFGSRPIHAATLAFDVALVAGVAFRIEQVRRRAHVFTAPLTALPHADARTS